jgi:hypothetical protein
MVERIREATMHKRLSVVIFTALLPAGMLLQSGCSMTQSGSSTDVFRYDPAEFPGAKPWTSENFKNNPDNFQFAILGDRGSGASPLGTYERAIDQLNLLQPEFVMKGGDYVEGYTRHQAEMDSQWDELETIIAKLQMPSFYVWHNHDINMPLTRKAGSERRGPKYYHFRYMDVLFKILDAGDAEWHRCPSAEACAGSIPRARIEESIPRDENWAVEGLRDFMGVPTANMV